MFTFESVPFVLGLELSETAKEEMEEILKEIEDRCDYYNWEEQDYQEGKLMYEYGLEGFQELAVREKMR